MHSLVTLQSLLGLLTQLQPIGYPIVLSLGPQGWLGHIADVGLRQLSGLVVTNEACCTESPGFKPWVGSPRIFKLGFHQQPVDCM